jgi:riboflavin synthase
VSRRAGAIFEADVVPETLARTTLGRLRKGDVVHLERSLAVGDRLGGHIVLGHVDAVAKVLALRRLRADVRLTVATPSELAGLVAYKGSIALQGVSLTVSAVTAKSFEVALIPETLARTRLGAARPGDGLNVEVDLLARYLDAWMRGRGLSRSRAGNRTRST